MTIYIIYIYILHIIYIYITYNIYIYYSGYDKTLTGVKPRRNSGETQGGRSKDRSIIRPVTLRVRIRFSYVFAFVYAYAYAYRHAYAYEYAYSHACTGRWLRLLFIVRPISNEIGWRKLFCRKANGKV